jgi:hypothetical protein
LATARSPRSHAPPTPLTPRDSPRRNRAAGDQSGRTSSGREPQAEHRRRLFNDGTETDLGRPDISTLARRQQEQATSTALMPRLRMFARSIAGPVYREVMAKIRQPQRFISRRKIYVQRRRTRDDSSHSIGVATRAQCVGAQTRRSCLWILGRPGLAGGVPHNGSRSRQIAPSPRRLLASISRKVGSVSI